MSAIYGSGFAGWFLPENRSIPPQNPVQNIESPSTEMITAPDLSVRMILEPTDVILSIAAFVGWPKRLCAPTEMTDTNGVAASSNSVELLYLLP